MLWRRHKRTHTAHAVEDKHSRASLCLVGVGDLGPVAKVGAKRCVFCQKAVLRRENRPHPAVLRAQIQRRKKK